jgi:hypothetical protein
MTAITYWLASRTRDHLAENISLPWCVLPDNDAGVASRLRRPAYARIAARDVLAVRVIVATNVVRQKSLHLHHPLEGGLGDRGRLFFPTKMFKFVMAEKRGGSPLAEAAGR